MKIFVKMSVMCILMLVWMLGVCGADSLADNGYLWLCLLMVFVPMLIGVGLGKLGWWEELYKWMEEKEKDIFGKVD